MIKITLKEAFVEKSITRYESSKRMGIQYRIIDKYYKNKVIIKHEYNECFKEL